MKYVSSASPHGICRRNLGVRVVAAGPDGKGARFPVPQRVDTAAQAAYLRRLSVMPCRLKVRLRTLTPLIEVRILTGHPIF